MNIWWHVHGIYRVIGIHVVNGKGISWAYKTYAISDSFVTCISDHTTRVHRIYKIYMYVRECSNSFIVPSIPLSPSQSKYLHIIRARLHSVRYIDCNVANNNSIPYNIMHRSRTSSKAKTNAVLYVIINLLS